MLDPRKNYRSEAEFEGMRIAITIFEIVVLFLLGCTAFINPWLGASLFLSAGAFFLWDGIREFPDNPPTNWIPKVFGVSVNKLRGWGLTWLPLMGLFGNLGVSFTEMSGGLMHDDVEPKEMIPGDRSTVLISVHLWYSVDPKNPMQVFLVGGLENAKARLLELIDKLFRQWITMPEKGPEDVGNKELTLDRVRRMPNEAVNHILEELCRDDIAAIPSDIPTEALMGYFEGRPLSPRETNWIKEYERRTPEEKAATKKAIEERIQDIDDLRTGAKTFPVNSVGLVVRVMVVDNIEPDKGSAESLKKVFDANCEAEVQMIHAKNLRAQAEELKPITITMDPVQAALILRGDTKQTITRTEFGLSPDTLAVADKLGGAVVAGVVNRFLGGKDADNGNDRSK